MGTPATHRHPHPGPLMQLGVRELLHEYRKSGFLVAAALLVIGGVLTSRSELFSPTSNFPPPTISHATRVRASDEADARADDAGVPAPRAFALADDSIFGAR